MKAVELYEVELDMADNCGDDCKRCDDESCGNCAKCECCCECCDCSKNEGKSCSCE